MSKKMLAEDYCRKDFFLNFLLQLYCILLPFEEALAGSFGSVVKLVGVLIIGYILIVYRKLTFRTINIIIMAWFVLAFFSFLWAESFSWWITYIKIYVSQFAFLLAVTSVPNGAIDTRKIRKGLIIGSSIAALTIMCFPQASEFTDDGRRSIILFGHAFDPNIVSGIICLGIASALEEIFITQKRKKRIILLILLALGFIGIFFTGSRGGLISAVVVCAVSLFLELQSDSNSNKKLSRRLVVIATIIIIIIIPFLPESLLEDRFNAENILGLNEYKAGAHNRYSIWLSALNLIPRRPILGYGVGNFLSAITKVYPRSSASHNLYLLLIVETGLIGLILVCLFLVKLLRCLKKQKKYTTFGLLVGVMVMALTLDCLPYKFFWVAILYAELRISERENQYI